MKEEKEELYKTIHLNEVKRMLGFVGKGYRAVLTWCKKHKLEVIGEGKRRRILESDWIRSQQSALVKSLQRSHPKSWKQILASRGIQWQTTIRKSENRKYEPQSDLAKNFLKGGNNE